MEKDQPHQTNQNESMNNQQLHNSALLQELLQFEKIAASFSPSSRMKQYTRKIKESIMEEKSQTIGIPIEYEIKNPTKSPFCSITVGYSQNRSRIFKCLDCMQASNSIICRQCFFASDHRGHQFQEMTSGQGCCDCGNEEMLNPKGFCSQHSPMTTEPKINEKVQALFLTETTFLFHFGFWIQKKAEQNYLIKKWGISQMQPLFDKLIELAALNYDYKFLCFKALQQTCKKLYPTLPSLGYEHKTIMEICFRVPAKKYLQKFINLLDISCQISEISCDKIIFHKTREDQNFSSEHPLRMLNCQFMTCIKAINLMIKQNNLKHLRLPESSRIVKNANLVFLKFADDLHYPSSMKGMDQYSYLLFERQNITEIFFTYRQLPDQMVAKEAFDQYFIKIFRHFLKAVEPYKNLLKKIIGELFAYLKENKDISQSLAHERALALTIVAYLDTDIFILANPNKALQFNKDLGLDESNMKSIMQSIILRHLQITLNILYERPMRVPQDYLSEYFQSQNPEKNILLMLDCCFQKIFALLCSHYVSYEFIVSKMLQKLLCQTNKQLKVYKLISFLNFAFSIDVDVCSVSSFIGLKNQRSNLFYGKLIKTFKQLNSKSTKSLALAVLFDEQLFQEFVKNQCYLQRGMLKTNYQLQMLQYLSYSGFFKLFSIPIENLLIATKKSTFLPQFEKLSLWSNQSIEVLVNFFQTYIANESSLRKNQNHSRNLTAEAFGLQLVKIYVNTFKCQHLQSFLIQQLQLLSQKQNWGKLLEILKQTLPLSLSSEIIESEQDFKNMKKMKFLQQKKEQMEKMKKQHQQILKNHHYQHNQLSADVCIFCKQTSQQELHLICSVKIDDSFNKLALKDDSFRICFRTCSHKIHPSCFYQKQEENQNKFCFLCKRPSNLLVPEFKNRKNSPEDISSFLNIIYPTLLSQNQYFSKLVESFYEIECAFNILPAIINSIIVQILTLGIHQKSFIKLNIKPIFQQLFHVIKELTQEAVIAAFQCGIHFKQNPLSDQYRLLKNLVNDYFRLKTQEFQAQYSHTTVIQQQQAIIKTLDYLSGSSSDYNLAQFKTVNFDECIFKMPRKLTQLQFLMGKCPHRPAITQKIFVCVLCGWRACFKSKQIVTDHYHSHKNGTVLVSCNKGEILYFINEGYFIRSSMYIDYLGQPFQSKQFRLSDSKNYNLDQKKYDYLIKSLIRNEIHLLLAKQLS